MKVHARECTLSPFGYCNLLGRRMLNGWALYTHTIHVREGKCTYHIYLVIRRHRLPVSGVSPRKEQPALEPAIDELVTNE